MASSLSSASVFLSILQTLSVNVGLLPQEQSDQGSNVCFHEYGSLEYIGIHSADLNIQFYIFLIDASIQAEANLTDHATLSLYRFCAKAFINFIVKIAFLKYDGF